MTVSGSDSDVGDAGAAELTSGENQGAAEAQSEPGSQDSPETEAGSGEFPAEVSPDAIADAANGEKSADPEAPGDGPEKQEIQQ